MESKNKLFPSVKSTESSFSAMLGEQSVTAIKILTLDFYKTKLIAWIYANADAFGILSKLLK